MGDAETAEYPPFPVPRVCPFHQPERSSGEPAGKPVSRVSLPTGSPAWLVTGHALVRQILMDPRASSDRTHPGFPHLNAVPVANLPKSTPPLIALDPPEHTVHRRMFISEFTVKRMQQMRPRIQQVVDGCIDELLAGSRPADLVQALSVPVPSMVMCELLGVPYEDRTYFKERTRVLLKRNSDPAEARTSLMELMGYFDRLITGKEEAPGDDLLGRAIVKYRETGTYDHHYMVKSAALLLNAGHETTANMISLAVVALLEHPGQLADLRADPRHTPQAVEELLRYFSVVDHTMARVALDDIEIGGETVRAGEGLIVLPSTANRDGEVFDHPDRLDISRADVRRHVAFGYGNHQCLGQNLARVELEIALNTLFARVPGLTLVKPVEELAYKDQEQVYGLYELPVTW
jgi:cytochrome P450